MYLTSLPSLFKFVSEGFSLSNFLVIDSLTLVREIFGKIGGAPYFEPVVKFLFLSLSYEGDE